LSGFYDQNRNENYRTYYFAKTLLFYSNISCNLYTVNINADKIPLKKTTDTVPSADVVGYQVRSTILTQSLALQSTLHTLVSNTVSKRIHVQHMHHYISKRNIEHHAY